MAANSLIIRCAIIYTPDEVQEEVTIVVENGRFQSITPSTAAPSLPIAPVLDAQKHLLVPGFLDLQLNGAFGHDFTDDPAAIWLVAAQLPQFGVTAFLPTLVSAPLTTYSQAQQTLFAGPSAGFIGAVPLGLHVEGPFLHPAQKGAHYAAHLQVPTLLDVAEWSRQQGVWLVTLAPDLPGATAVITALVRRGVTVSAGHSPATYQEAQAGVDAGIRYGTHLFNAMSPLHHREPGLPGALLDDERVTIGLIPDGLHVHPALVRLVWPRIAHRLNLVTDAMAALGLPPAQYRLGHQDVFVSETAARLADGTLAGSLLSLDTAVRNLMAFTGCTLAEALPTVTTIPARLMGLGQRKGRIAPGYDADFVLLTRDFRVAATYVAGQQVYVNLPYA